MNFSGSLGFENDGDIGIGVGDVTGFGDYVR